MKMRYYRKIAAVRAAHNIKCPNPWIPFGYYKNRLKVFSDKLENGIGNISCVRFVVSKPK